MNVTPLTVSRDEALKYWKKYQTHKHNWNALDADVMRIYEAISKGKVIINALASIVKAGLGEDQLPKLAICRADAKVCHLSTRMSGACVMIADAQWTRGNMAKSRYFEFPDNCFPGLETRRDRKAMVPHIPPDIRPKRGIQNYHILWEAVWEWSPPVDPMLLRHMGEDLWLVVGAWDLTDVERSVMEMHANKRNRS